MSAVAFVRRHSDALLLMLMVAAAACFRWPLVGCSLTHDEVSAATRLAFSHFSELIRNGVIPDGHPAGLQLFYWFWVRLFGCSDLSLRLPAFVVGLACIPAAYAMGRVWVNRSCGLFVAAYVAFSQYGMLYGVLARPYGFGLLAALLLACCWGGYVWRQWSGWRNSLCVVLLLDACAYLHYFSFLFACLMALAGVLLLPKERLKRYLWLCLSAVALYLPHLPVFLAQFSRRGVGGADGWLPAPTAAFWVDYPRYLLHFSVGLALVTLFIGVWFSVKNRRQFPPLWKRWCTASALFLAPLLIAYFYSVHVNPVLQYSVLIFSLPMGLVAFFFLLDARWDAFKTLLLLAFSVALLVSLHERRGFFRLMRDSWYDIAVEKVKELERQYPGKTVCVFRMEPSFVRYYERKHHLKLPVLYCPYDRPDVRRIRTLCRASDARYVLVSGGVEEDRAVIRESFPCLLSYQPLHPLGLYLYGREPVAGAELPQPLWSRARSFQCLQVTAHEEYVGLFALPSDSLGADRYLQTDLTVTFMADDTLSDLLLVQEVWKGEERVDWRSCSLKRFVMPGDSLQQAHLPDRFDRLSIPRRDWNKVEVRWYFWNPDGGASYRLCGATLSAWPANREWLGLTHDVRR